MIPRLAAIASLAALVSLANGPALAQQLDLSHGGPIDVTARDGIEWRQNQKEIIARGSARAVRENVTVTADRLIAHYRKKGGAPDAAQPTESPKGGVTGDDADTSGNEIYRVEAEGHVRIFTPTDLAEGDRAIYDLDQAVLLMTGKNLKLTTPQNVLTARDTMEYWSQKHMAVARGNAVVLTHDGRRIAADTLVAYTTDAPRPAEGSAQPVRASPKPEKEPDDPLAASGKLQKVDAIGNVSVRTATETVTGDRAVYVPDTGIARVAGQVRITRGQNQLNGVEAEVNLRTGVSRLLSGPSGRVQGLVVPNDASNQQGPAALDLGAPKGQPAGRKGTQP
jgi:lipopolysaccharide export system protein LptA